MCVSETLCCSHQIDGTDPSDFLDGGEFKYTGIQVH